MNCKPGDLAMLVRALPQFPEQVGRIFVVTVMDPLAPEPAWFYEGAMIRRQEGRHRMSWASLPDCWLRPIRDSGDDAVDETLRGLPQEVETV